MTPNITHKHFSEYIVIPKLLILMKHLQKLKLRFIKFSKLHKLNLIVILVVKKIHAQTDRMIKH